MAKTAFRYQPRSKEEVERRANQSGGDFKGFIKDKYRTYTPSKGDNLIRILPPTWEDPMHYGMDLWVHYNIGPDHASILCPEKHNRGKCPLCEERARAERLGDEDSAAELKPTKRVAVWVLDYNNENDGPLIWAMPWTIDRDVAKISKDRRSGELYAIDDPQDGYDLSFDKTGENITTKYAGFQLSRKPTSVDDKHIDYVVENPLPETFLWRNYDEINELYQGVITNRDSKPRESSRDDRDARRESRDERREERPREERGGRDADREEAPRETRARERVDEDKPPFENGHAKDAAPREREKVDTRTGSDKVDALRERFAARKAQ